jgi:opacity protein-like surface antigen
MKCLVRAVFLLLAATTLARAADLSPARATPDPMNPMKYSWTGCYLGVSLGGNFANSTNNLTLFGMAATGATTFGGGSAGGQAGCNFETPNNLVYGFEVDGQAGFPIQFGTAITALGAVTNSLPVFGTFRGRIGYAPVSNVLLYVTGGGGIGLEAVALTQGTMANPITQVSTQTRGLWTVGAGVESAIYGNWTAKVEYLYTATGTTTANFNVMGIPSTVTTKLNDSVVRVGVNYRF